ncbi:hypothetical protein B1B_07398 [mine drainage metagenome]|uniref:SseB protein N-terminal domain-containing protein n=1 Tax=mine drainage metagenome TaxID=410659 RepID=T1AXE2_9ZZZZ
MEPTHDALEPTALEQALSELGEDLASRERALVAFIQATVWLLADHPVDGHPDALQTARFALVSDGPRLDQPMLSLFTSAERADRYHREHPASLPCAVQAEAPFAILCIPEGAGMVINPNQTPGFRIGPEAATMLRNQMIELRRRASASNAPAS